MARVLQVGNMYPPHHLGGYELVWQSATRALRAAGHEARVLTTDFRGAGQGGAEDPDAHRELRWYWRDHGWPRLGPRERLALERHNARVFDRHVAQLRPDVIAWWAMGGMSLSLVERARRARLPAVGFVHDDWLIYGPRVDGWLRAAARLPAAGARVLDALAGVPTRVDLDASARWLLVSETTRRRAREHGALRLPDSAVVPSGVDEAYVGAATSAPRWSWRLLYVGRIDRRKGVDTAIEALARLPEEARLTVAGSGDQRELEALRAQAVASGVAGRVDFLGAHGRDELPAVYAAADVVLFPVRWEEPWGLVPLEAMALGRPVVATGAGGSGEYLRDGENCLLFAAGDAEALAAAARRLAEDPVLRDRLRDGGLRTARQHTERRFNERVVSELLSAATRGAGSRSADRHGR